ncbi:MAG: hypothetical protein RIQ60_1702 [Pseudomonadota bacterium]|jgi:hypothetical protein
MDQQGANRRAFISHATADDSYVAEMESFLRRLHMADVFNDAASIRPDEPIWPRIQQGIEESDFLVAIVSAASTASEWVSREVEHARGLGKTVIGVRIDDSPLPALFADRDVVDLRPRHRAEKRLDIGRILQYAPEQLIGRESELGLISDAWAKTLRCEAGRPHILTFVALGGEGKTSLVAKWTVDHLLARGWPGCEAAFAWSFYSQGTRDQVAASSDAFLKAALDFFAASDEDRAFAASPAGAYEKGQRLARLVGSRRSLLILDGLEPLQYAPTAPTPGELKDQGLTALLKGLAQQSQGLCLCLVTTRYSVPDLKAFRQSTAPEVALKGLSRGAGIDLLRRIGVKGHAPELATMVKDFKGHALTLTLLGRYLCRAFQGDIRKRDRLNLQKADARSANGHAFRVMAGYEKWLSRSGEAGQRELAILRMLGLFDRRADASCIAALRREPIQGLTEPLDDLDEEDWECCVGDLESMGLLSRHSDAGSSHFTSLDAHPLLREYFGQQLKQQQPEAWRTAHARLFEHLCASTKEGDQPTLEDLQPLYQAVAHGCLAGLQQRACDEVYFARIAQRGAFYATRKLGAFGSDLGAVACFFDQPWRRVSPALTDADQAWLLNEAALSLRALGRLTEALEPMRAGLDALIAESNWKQAAIVASNLSELELTLGEVVAAVQDAEQSVTHADRSGDAFERIARRTTHADALHQAARRDDAMQRFREAEQMQQQDEPDYPLLYSVQGFQYADLLLAATERAAWLGAALGQPRPAEEAAAHREALQEVGQRAAQTLEWVSTQDWLLDIALDHLNLARTALFTALLTQAEPAAADLAQARREADAAVSGLRRAGQQDHLPRGLLTRAWLRAITGPLTGPDSAQADLDEAWEIAERGPMRLHMADIHLYRVRLFFREANYPARWGSPEADLQAARELIERCGYGRRREELEDAEQALRRWRAAGDVTPATTA